EGLKLWILLVRLEDALTYLVHTPASVDGLPDALAQLACCQTEMRLENLADVHATRHAERVEHDVHRSAIGEVRHVFFWKQARNHTLVSVTPCHLVANLKLALDGDVYLHHLDDARRQLITAAQTLDLVTE